ncbi:MAG TPA: hypothetical protein EYP14_19355 [Planctomycetaceae bacterium]|nr:hypothetical protein [Planctomycetaceae bacterium]
MPFETFDRNQLRLRPLAERVHDVQRDVLIPAETAEHAAQGFEHPALPVLAERIVEARDKGASVIFFCGAHVLRQGNGPLLIDLMQRGLLTHLALNGAGAIHDFELAMIGQTCESVARYVREGQFGLWQETGRINQAAPQAVRDQIGLGEAIGRMIEQERFPYRQTSVLAAAYRLQVPVTVHVAIGQDIIHEHPNFDAPATGAASYTDFLIFTRSVSRLEGGVFLNIGTAVMGPEIYLKALAMARNVAHQRGESIRHFTTAVFDLVDLGEDTAHEAPKHDPRYYFRPFKTILVRTVADGGESYYVQGEHRVTVPALYCRIRDRSETA